MSFTHNIFLPLPIRDNSPKANDPEIKFIDIDCNMTYGYKSEKETKTISGKPFKKLIIEWAFYIESKATNKELMYLGGRDIYDVEEPIAPEFDYEKLVIESHDRFTSYFNKIIPTDQLIPLDRIEIDHICLDVTKKFS